MDILNIMKTSTKIIYLLPVLVVIGYFTIIFGTVIFYDILFVLQTAMDEDLKEFRMLDMRGYYFLFISLAVSLFIITYKITQWIKTPN